MKGQEARRCSERKSLKGCAPKRVKQACLWGRNQATGKAKKLKKQIKTKKRKRSTVVSVKFCKVR